jgi:hypothetical protein
LTYTPPTLEASESQGIDVLRGRYAGETAWIIGKGPSLVNLRACDIGPGPVLTLNQVILHVQRLGLPQPVYALQIDGCETEDPDTIPRPCGSCEPLGWQRPPLVDPFPGIAVVFNRYFSSWCLHGRRNRYVIDTEFYDIPTTPSALQAVGLARWMGCAAIVMVAFDNLTGGSDETLWAPEDDAKRLRVRSNLEWLRPRLLAALDGVPHSFLVP